MQRNPYQRFRGQQLTLNDYLAIDRTVLANERTRLAHERTALALAVVGATGLKFFADTWIRLASVTLILLGVIMVLRGWYGYWQTKRLLATALEQQTGAPEHPLSEDASSSREKPATKEQ